MTVERPTADDLEAINRRLRLGLTPAEIDEFVSLVDETLGIHDWLEQVGENGDVQADGTRASYRPSGEENPLGAWYYKTSIVAGAEGALTGRSVVVKDNICVAGLPMMNGSTLLEGFVPDRDATVVERILAAGATIVGKAVCESLSYSGGSHTSDTGPVRNPYDPKRSSGGSSSGCAVLVAVGEADLAIGGDQGGSIRGPSSWSGVYGLKPTFGLVPYTGAFPLEMTLDHLGPMARTAADLGLLLDVLAGPDGLDPRQRTFGDTAPSYQPLSTGSLEGMRLGVLGEGFGWETSESDVDEVVRAAISDFSSLGAEIVDVSVPWHREGSKLTHAIAAEGSTALLIHGNGAGTNWRGLYPSAMMAAFARGRAGKPEKIPAMLKLQALVGQWLHDRYDGRYYAKAQNAGHQLAHAYDGIFTAIDVLAMPTTPIKATLLPPPGISNAESTRVGHQMGANTAPFNVTGHPALSLPCGLSDGLPIGLMLVGGRGNDATLIRAADAYEKNVYRIPPPPTPIHSSGDPRAGRG